MKGLIFDIKRFALHDGPGIRVTIFLKGCPLNCHWCHNPEGINFSIDDGIGQLMSTEQVMREITKERIFFEESGGGVTFSGGEPLMQPIFLETLVKECRNRGFHVTLDTSGEVSPEVFGKFIDKIDLFLYDLKIYDQKEHQAYTGHSNQNILDNLKFLASTGGNAIIRFPLIPGYTDSKKNINDVAKFIKSLNSINKVEVLPYHNTAKNKYQRYKIVNKTADIQPPTERDRRAAEAIFKEHGLIVTGGLNGGDLGKEVSYESKN